MIEAAGSQYRWRWILAIVLLALVLRLGVSLSTEPSISWSDGHEYDGFARSIAEKHEYLDQFGRPSASRPPLYPAFLSLTGRNTAVTRIIQSAIGAITALVVYAIAMRLFGRRKALLAAVFFAIYPLYIYAAAVYYPIVLLTLLLGGVFLLLTGALEEHSGSKAFWAGLLGGMLALTAGSYLVPLGLAFLWIIWESRRSGTARSGFRLAVLFLIPLLLVTGAWSIRNYRALGAFVPISTNSGYNFWIGNFPGTKATTGNRSIPGRMEEESALQNEFPGEVERDHAYYRKGLEHIKAAPGRFIILSIEKALNFWRLYPVPMSRDPKHWEIIACILSYGVLLPFGLYWLIRNVRGSPEVRLILLVFLSFTLFHALFISKVRLRLPLDMLLVISAAGGIGDLMKRFGLRTLEP
jgi:4-amino-4-deoxy-L-arabinose transferase-like glycosyltransferase